MWNVHSLDLKGGKKAQPPVWPSSLLSCRICVCSELSAGICVSVSSSSLVGCALYVSTVGEACCGSADTVSSSESAQKKRHQNISSCRHGSLSIVLHPQIWLWLPLCERLWNIIRLSRPRSTFYLVIIHPQRVVELMNPFGLAATVKNSA